MKPPPPESSGLTRWLTRTLLAFFGAGVLYLLGSGPACYYLILRQHVHLASPASELTLGERVLGPLYAPIRDVTNRNAAVRPLQAYVNWWAKKAPLVVAPN
jgi:hypothetical protein